MNKFSYLLRCVFGFGNRSYMLLAIFGVLLTLGMFQNCSPVGFKQVTGVAGGVELTSEAAPSCGSTPAPGSRETLLCPVGSVGLGGLRTRQISCSGSSWIATPWSEIDYSSCTCSGGRVINPTSGLCECNAGKEFIGGTCTVSACNATLKPPESDTVLCPSGFGNASRSRTVNCSVPNWNAGAWSGYNFSKCTCAYIGQVLNATTGSCACPVGQTVVGGSCQALPPMTCSLGTKPPDTQTLTCPSGSLGSYVKSTSVACVSGAWVSGASVNNYNTCSCPATGQIFNATTTPACNCPATAPVLSGGACVTAADAACPGTPPDKNQDVRCPGPESTGTIVNTRVVTCNTSTKIWTAGLFPEPNFSTCRCPYSKQSSDSKGVCTCPTGTNPLQASLSCGVCLSGQTYDPVSKSCVSSGTGGTSGCAAAEVKWGETNGCNAIVADSAANQILNLTSRTFVGNAQFKCNATTKNLEFVSGTCKASCTVSSEYKSAWMDSACMGIMPIGVYSHEKTFRIAADPSLSASSAAAGVTSTNSYLDVKCYDGKIITMGAACRFSTATGAKCSGGPIKWDSSGLNDAGICTANVAETESGYGQTVGNTYSGYQGNFTGYCVNGKWEGVSSVVGCSKLSGIPQNCTGTYASPAGSSCKFSYTAPPGGVPSGWSQNLNNTASGYLGSSKLVCGDGNWWQGPIIDCAPVGSTLKCPRIDLCSDLATLSDVPIKACFQQDPIFAGGMAIVTSWNQPDCQAHINCDSDGQWSYTKSGGKLDLSGTCKLPVTPIPSVVKCLAGTAPIESTPNSSGKTNTCTFTWPEGTVGQTKTPTATNGGTGSLTCQSTGSWSYNYTCPPPGVAVVCAGGSQTVMSSPNSIGEKNSCIFSWAQGNVGQTINPTGTNGGTGSLTCGATGSWSYSYICPTPGNPVVCPGGSQAITSLKSSDGKTNTCVFSWDQGTAGNTITPIGTNGGTGSLTCGATGAWSYSYKCPPPDKSVTCLGGTSAPIPSATKSGVTCTLSWPESPVSATTVKGTGTNGGTISGVCTSTGEWKSVVSTCP